MSRNLSTHTETHLLSILQTCFSFVALLTWSGKHPLRKPYTFIEVFCHCSSSLLRHRQSLLCLLWIFSLLSFNFFLAPLVCCLVEVTSNFTHEQSRAVSGLCVLFLQRRPNAVLYFNHTKLTLLPLMGDAKCLHPT